VVNIPFPSFKPQLGPPAQKMRNTPKGQHTMAI
jgi:hypothetical protein